MIEVRSPKLGRLVQHYDHASFQQWVCLEADPGVCAFCERPARIGPDPTSQLINYWVSRKQTQEFVMRVTGQMPADLRLKNSTFARQPSHLDCPKKRFGSRCCVRKCGALGD